MTTTREYRDVTLHVGDHVSEWERVTERTEGGHNPIKQIMSIKTASEKALERARGLEVPIEAVPHLTAPVFGVSVPKLVKESPQPAFKIRELGTPEGARDAAHSVVAAAAKHGDPEVLIGALGALAEAQALEAGSGRSAPDFDSFALAFARQYAQETGRGFMILPDGRFFPLDDNEIERTLKATILLQSCETLLPDVAGEGESFIDTVTRLRSFYKSNRIQASDQVFSVAYRLASLGPWHMKTGDCNGPSTLTAQQAISDACEYARKHGPDAVRIFRAASYKLQIKGAINIDD